MVCSVLLAGSGVMRTETPLAAHFQNVRGRLPNGCHSPPPHWNRLLREAAALCRTARKPSLFSTSGNTRFNGASLVARCSAMTGLEKIADASASRKDGIQRRRGDGRRRRVFAGVSSKGSVPEMLSKATCTPGGRSRAKPNQRGRLRCLRASVPRSVGT